MMRMIRIATAVVAVSGMTASLVAAQAAKAPAAKPPAAAKPAKAMDLSKYPAPVRATIENETKNATLKGVSKETEKGKTQYEVETLVNGKSRDLLVDPAGKVIEVEEEIALSAAPQAVQTELGKHGTVVKVEKVTREGGAATYEASVKAKSGKTTSVALDADGKPVKG
jgi:uncharacterized membrane protein YkoI